MTTEDGIDAALVRLLISEQFPRWSDLPVRPVARQGWDNRTFRLGDSLAVRLPSADGYVAGLMREERTLATLGQHLQIPIPQVIATGAPSDAFGRAEGRRHLRSRPAVRHPRGCGALSTFRLIFGSEAADRRIRIGGLQ